MKLSIIIPVYNVAAFIPRALDSIYSQGMKEDEFEVICVDDCSPDNSYDVMTDYLYEGCHPENLIILRHTINKRQGGARNTGLKVARGKWILFLDADDFYLPDTLKKLLEAAEEDPELDTVMFSSQSGDGVIEDGNASCIPLNLDTHTMTGEEFFQKIPVPRNPWSYLYRRDHLLTIGLFFEENIRYEDTDFVLKYTAHSKAIRFLPLVVYYYWNTNSNSTTHHGGNDSVGMMDTIYLAYRIYRVALEEKSRYPIASKVVMENAMLTFRRHMRRYSWRLSFRNRLNMLRKYRFSEPTGDHLFDFVNRHPLFAAIAITAMKPFFFVAIKAWGYMYKNIERNN